MATFNNNGSSQWTEVIHKKKQQQQSDPFAGMNTSINYQQEIERLKQLVPKAEQPLHKKPTTTRKHHYIPNTNTNYHNTISRSNSPDSSSDSSDSSSLSSSDQYVSEQEKLRFFTFVRNWTAGTESQKTVNIQDFYSTDSLWADQSPWNRSIPSSNRNRH